jgi:NTE family protein
MRLAGLMLSVVLLSAGCATHIDNAPANLPITARASAAIEAARSGGARDQVIGISLSGGGLRAAAFGFGVMQELAAGEPDVYDDVHFISSVSGGSLTAAYLALEGRPGLISLRNKVLLHNYELDLRLSLWSPTNLMRILAGGMNDRSNLAQIFDRDVFSGATFNDLYARGGPELWINATDLYNRTPFPFVPQVFSALCSDLGSVRISDAVAASMAVPLAFAPMVLKTYPDHCASPLPPWVSRASQDKGGVTAGLLASTARAVTNYRDPKRMRYVKLADGGLTDNQGLSSILVARAAANTPYDPFTESDAVRLRHALFLVVDAGRPPIGDWALGADGPSGFDVGLAALDAAVDSATRLSVQVFKEEMSRWHDQIVDFRCSLPPERVRAWVPEGQAWDCRDLSFDVDVLSFENLPAPLQGRLRSMPTTLVLSAEDVDAAIDAGRQAARKSAALLRYRMGASMNTQSGSANR